VFGEGVGHGTGVTGRSEKGRGGVFTTAQPPSGVPPVAQVQLVPLIFDDVRPGQQDQVPDHGYPAPLPINGRAGDVLAISPLTDKTKARLWFCIESGSGPSAPALWAEISFARAVRGAF
jgi:hypothetical protein